MALSRIPRGSKNEAAAAQRVADQAKALGCDVVRDAVGNVIIRKQATPGREQAPVTALQAHVDMVCEKNEATVHDFLKDPIALRRDGTASGPPAPPWAPTTASASPPPWPCWPRRRSSTGPWKCSSPSTRRRASPAPPASRKASSRPSTS